MTCLRCQTSGLSVADYLRGHARRATPRCIDPRWQRVAELRGQGDHDGAARAARKAMGVQGPPMTEEKKAELRRYAQEHAPEIKARRKARRAVRQIRMKACNDPRRRGV